MLELFLLLDCFVAGVLAVVAFDHWRAHREIVRRAAEAARLEAEPKPVAAAPRPPLSPLPPKLKHEAIVRAQEQYEHILNASAETLQHDLASTDEATTSQIRHLASEIITKELEAYRHDLAHLREQAIGTMGQTQAVIEQQRVELQAKIEADMTAERERRKVELDTKLNDAVSAFLLDTLQHHVDLGAQTAYLMDQLTEHKAELKKEVLG